MNTIATNLEKLYDKAEKYSKTSIELVKLEAIDKTSDVISSLAVITGLFMIVAVFSIFINIGIALYIGKILNNSAYGFFIISIFYGLLGIIIYIFRNTTIKYPIDNLIVKTLLKSKYESDHTAEQEDL